MCNYQLSENMLQNVTISSSERWCLVVSISLCLLGVRMPKVVNLLCVNLLQFVLNEPKCYNLVMLFFILSDSWPVWIIISYYLALIVSSLLYLWLSVASRPDSHYSLIWHSSKLNLLSFSYLSLDWCFHSLLSSYLVLYISLLIFSLLLCFMFSHSCSLYDSLNTFLTCLYLKFMTLSYLVLWVLVYKPHCMFLIL